MSGRSLAVAVLLLSTACSSGPGARTAPVPAPAPTPAGVPVPAIDPAGQVAADAAAVTPANGLLLPALFTRHHIFIRATIGGIPGLLLFDSGASATILSPRIVRRLALAYRGRHLAFGIGEPVTSASQYDGTEIAMGPLAIRPATVLSWADAGLPTYAGATPDGVIGYDLLRAYVVLVDVHGGRLVAFDSGATRPPIRRGGQAIPLRVTNGLPVVDMELFAGPQMTTPSEPSASTLPIVIDFGAGAGLQISRSTAERIALTARLRDARPRQLVGIGGMVEILEGITDSVRVAGATIPQAIVAADTTTVTSIALANAEGFVGTEVLRRFAVTLDYSRGRAVFEPNVALRTPFCRNAAGLCVRTESSLRGAEVYFVDPGSPGARIGIRPGMLLLAVDGTSVAQFSPAEIDRLLDRGPGAVLEIVRNSAQFRAINRDTGPQRSPASRRPPPRERVGETVRLPSP
jgi:hypothetical protein